MVELCQGRYEKSQTVLRQHTGYLLMKNKIHKILLVPLFWLRCTWCSLWYNCGI